MPLELPVPLLAERLSWLLVIVAGVAVETLLLRHPDLPSGPGVLLASLLAGWLWRGRRRSLRQVDWSPAGWVLRFADGRTRPARLEFGTRVLGGTAVLRWRLDGGRSIGAWLTPIDLPREAIRSLALRLATEGSGRGHRGSSRPVPPRITTGP